MDQLIECSPQAQEVGILFDHQFTNADTEAQRGQATCWRSSSFQASEPGMMISILWSQSLRHREVKQVAHRHTGIK